MQVQWMTELESWGASSALPSVRRALEAGTISRRLLSTLTPTFRGADEVDEALVGMVPWAAALARAFYQHGVGSLEELLPRAHLRALDAWLTDELEDLTDFWRTLEEEAGGYAAPLRRAEELVRAEVEEADPPAPARAALRILELHVSRLEDAGRRVFH
jgi:hypothetical protein